MTPKSKKPQKAYKTPHALGKKAWRECCEEIKRLDDFFFARAQECPERHMVLNTSKSNGLCMAASIVKRYGKLK